MYLWLGSFRLLLDVVWGKVLVIGMSGTGKTAMLRFFAKQLRGYGVSVHFINFDELSAESFESRLQSIHSELLWLLSSGQRTVIVVDDTDLIISKNPRVLKILEEITCTSKHGIGLIAALQHVKNMPVDILKCFSTYIILKSNANNIKNLGVEVDPSQVENLRIGEAIVVSNYLPKQIKIRFSVPCY